MLAVFVLLLLTIYSWWAYKNWSSPACLMSGLWTVIVFTYELNKTTLRLNSVQETTYIIICLGVLSFVIGTRIANKAKLILRRKNVGQLSATGGFTYYTILYKAVFSFAIISFFFYLPDAINSIRLLFSGSSFLTLRSNVGQSVITNPLLAVVRNYIISPFVIFLYPTSAYCLLSLKDESEKQVKKRKAWIFIIATAIAVLQLFTSGGRSTIVYLLSYVLVIQRVIKGHFRLSRRTKRLIVILIIGAVVGVYFISVSRGIVDVGQSMIIYLCGCVPLADHYLNLIAMQGSYTYGGAFFYGPLNLLFALIENIGIPEPNFMASLSSKLYFENIVRIGELHRINAFVSWLTYFFMDGGYFTLIIESIVYGMIAHGFYKYATGYVSNLRKILAYAIVANTILFSMVRFQFIRYHYLLAFVYVFIFVKAKQDDRIHYSNQTQ